MVGTHNPVFIDTRTGKVLGDPQAGTAPGPDDGTRCRRPRHRRGPPRPPARRRPGDGPDGRPHRRTHDEADHEADDQADDRADEAVRRTRPRRAPDDGAASAATHRRTTARARGHPHHATVTGDRRPDHDRSRPATGGRQRRRTVRRGPAPASRDGWPDPRAGRSRRAHRARRARFAWSTRPGGCGCGRARPRARPVPLPGTAAAAAGRRRAGVRRRAEAGRLQTVDLTAERGEITDRNGVVLATPAAARERHRRPDAGHRPGRRGDGARPLLGLTRRTDRREPHRDQAVRRTSRAR